MMKPRVMERPLLPWDAFCGLYYPIGQQRGAIHPGMLLDLLPATPPPHPLPLPPLLLSPLNCPVSRRLSQLSRGSSHQDGRLL